jgi:hypothetical protein
VLVVHETSSSNLPRNFEEVEMKPMATYTSKGNTESRFAAYTNPDGDLGKLRKQSSLSCDPGVLTARTVETQPGSRSGSYSAQG